MLHRTFLLLSYLILGTLSYEFMLKLFCFFCPSIEETLYSHLYTITNSTHKIILEKVFKH